MNAEKKRKIVTLVYDQELQSLLKDFIPGREYELESAHDGLDGFHKLAKTYFDLIITDFRMPGLGGVKSSPPFEADSALGPGDRHPHGQRKPESAPNNRIRSRYLPGEAVSN